MGCGDLEEWYEDQIWGLYNDVCVWKCHNENHYCVCELKVECLKPLNIFWGPFISVNALGEIGPKWGISPSILKRLRLPNFKEVVGLKRNSIGICFVFPKLLQRLNSMFIIYSLPWLLFIESPLNLLPISIRMSFKNKLFKYSRKKFISIIYNKFSLYFLLWVY